jgi:WD40 repeat protein
MFYRENASVVLLTSKFDLFQFKITVSNMKVPHKRVQLSLNAPPEKIAMEWIAPSSFALTSNEGLVRIWNVESNRNYSLSLSDGVSDNANFAIISGKFSSCKYT